MNVGHSGTLSIICIDLVKISNVLEESNIERERRVIDR